MTTPLDFKALVVAHQNAVCAIAYAVLRDRARSEEVAQEAFLVAWQKLPGMDPAPSLPGWVCGIARNLARNAARRRKELPMTPSTPEPIADTTALDDLLANESKELALRALATLSETEREAVVLYYRGDQSLAEVAAALEISEAAAKKRVLRGREHLRAAASDVETTLRITRPGPAFTAACVAAAAALGASHSASAATVRTAGRAKWIAGVAALPVLAAATWFVVRAPTTTADARPVVPTSSTFAPASALMRHIDPAEKRALEARIGAARAQRIAASGDVDEAHATKTQPGPMIGSGEADRTFDFSGTLLLDDPPQLPPRAVIKLDKHGLLEALLSVQPMIRECYERTGKHVVGTLQLQIRFEGEPGVGTVATDARVGGAGFDDNEELIECVSQTLLSIEMPGLDQGGITEIDYPFIVRPE